jgi:hypothetical protein
MGQEDYQIILSFEVPLSQIGKKAKPYEVLSIAQD